MERIPRTATLAIAAVTALAWVLAALSGYSNEAAYGFGFIPARFSVPPVPWLAAPAFLTPLTATLVHSGIVHLGFNLLVFIWCGSQVERVLGKSGLVLLYVVGAFAAAGAQYATEPHGTVPMIGASGAVSAVIGAYALSFGRARRLTGSLVVNRWINIFWLLAAWVVLQLMMGYLAEAGGYLLAIPAHVGGFVAGLLLQRPLLLWRYRSA
ncbi:MAG TPA: rhomboid family intramembrane serine protease [Sphingomicrobium sp.]|nr:rhomboid family intramembrane serine protease [Sphingomicrobium sp.]